MSEIVYKYITSDDQLVLLENYGLRIEPTDILGPEKWAYITAAFQSENIVGFCLSHLCYSTWKGLNLGIDKISAESSEIAFNLYEFTKRWAEDIGMTQIRFYSPLPEKFNFNEFGLVSRVH